jgi:hypothetical protein
MNGKRKSYKGWEPVEVRAVKETPGSNEIRRRKSGK